MEFSNAMDIRKAWKLKHKLIAESILKNGDYDHEQITRKVREALREVSSSLVNKSNIRTMERDGQNER